VLLTLLGVAPAYAGCSVVQTAGNEIVIRSSVGGCDAGALRAGLSSALSAATIPGQSSGERPNPLADLRRSSTQGALWRLANRNNQTPITSLTMPGAH
jgi:hypothetical protein